MIKLNKAVNEYLSNWRECNMCYSMVQHTKICTVATELYHELCTECCDEYLESDEYKNGGVVDFQ